MFYKELLSHYTSSSKTELGSHNFKNVVDLVAECGGKDLETHLLTASKNETYILPVYVAKYNGIMNKYLKAPLLALLRTGKYTLSNYKTQDISTEQMAVYAAFQHRNHISEHYIRILPISELVGSHLSAPNIFGALNKYLLEMNISLRAMVDFLHASISLPTGTNGKPLAYISKFPNVIGKLMICKTLATSATKKKTKKKHWLPML